MLTLREAASPPPTDPMVPVPMAVAETIRDTGDTFTLRLDASDRADGFPFAPGQFNMLYLFGVGEVPISISGDPDRPEELRHTIRALGTVTRRLVALPPGAVVGVRGPFGSSWPIAECRGQDVLVVAGGIGLAPLRAMVYHLLNHREEFGGVAVLYGARTPEDMLYMKELAGWRGRFDLSVHVTVDRGGRDWRGNVGVVTALMPKVRIDPGRTLALVCGPEVMMRFTVRELEKRGLGHERIYVSMERNMRCAVGFCGHCQYGPAFICRDGPVFRFDRLRRFFGLREF